MAGEDVEYRVRTDLLGDIRYLKVHGLQVRRSALGDFSFFSGKDKAERA